MQIDHESIAVRAYFIYLNQGCPEGQSLAHWYEAEQQIQAEHAPQKTGDNLLTAPVVGGAVLGGVVGAIIAGPVGALAGATVGALAFAKGDAHSPANAS